MGMIICSTTRSGDWGRMVMAPIWTRPIPLSEEKVRSTRALMALVVASAVGELCLGYSLAALVVWMLQ
jgi:hypothetical protein